MNHREVLVCCLNKAERDCRISFNVGVDGKIAYRVVVMAEETDLASIKMYSDTVRLMRKVCQNKLELAVRNMLYSHRKHKKVDQEWDYAMEWVGVWCRKADRFGLGGLPPWFEEAAKIYQRLFMEGATDGETVHKIDWVDDVKNVYLLE